LKRETIQDVRFLTCEGGQIKQKKNAWTDRGVDKFMEEHRFVWGLGARKDKRRGIATPGSLKEITYHK